MDSHELLYNLALLQLPLAHFLTADPSDELTCMHEEQSQITSSAAPAGATPSICYSKHMSAAPAGAEVDHEVGRKAGPEEGSEACPAEAFAVLEEDPAAGLAA